MTDAEIEELERLLRAEADSIEHQVRGQDPSDWREIGLMRKAADALKASRSERAMALALEKAAKQFRFYEKEHRAKAEKVPSHDTYEGEYIDRNQKADTNKAMAEMCEVALSPASEGAPRRNTRQVIMDWLAAESTKPHPYSDAAVDELVGKLGDGSAGKDDTSAAGAGSFDGHTWMSASEIVSARAHLAKAWRDNVDDLLLGKKMLADALDEIERLRTPPSSAGWLPMASAPKDGTPIYGLTTHDKVVICRCCTEDDNAQEIGIGAGEWFCGATIYRLKAWQPAMLPSPPAPSQEGASEVEGQDNPSSGCTPSSPPDPIREEMAIIREWIDKEGIRLEDNQLWRLRAALSLHRGK